MTARDDLIDRLANSVMPIVDQLRKENRDLARCLTETIQERDYAQTMADKLAAAIAPEDVLGEHSDGNFPWQNALEWATEKERAFTELRKELEDTVCFRDAFARSANHLARKRDRAETAIGAWEAGDLSADAALLLVKKALAVGEPEVAKAVQR